MAIGPHHQQINAMLFLIGVEGRLYLAVQGLGANSESGVEQHFLRPVQLRGRFVVHGPNQGYCARQATRGLPWQEEIPVV